MQKSNNDNSSDMITSDNFNSPVILVPQSNRKRIVHFFRTFGELYPQPFSITDKDTPDNELIYVNEKFCELTEFSSNEVIGKNCRFLQGESSKQDLKKLSYCIRNSIDCWIDILNYTKTKQPFVNRLLLLHYGENWVIGLQHVMEKAVASEPRPVRDALTAQFLEAVTLGVGSLRPSKSSNNPHNLRETIEKISQEIRFLK